MNKTMKTLLMVLCAIALVVCSVLGTLAYLKDSQEATNTFTAGRVDTELDEDDPDSTDPADRTEENEYHLIPGSSYDKDPTVHILSGSENCYTFVTVDNQIADLEGTPTIEAQMLANGWEKLTDDEGETVQLDGLDVWVFTTAEGENDGVSVQDYCIVDMTGKADVNLVVFNKLNIAGDVTYEDLADAEKYVYYQGTGNGRETEIDENGDPVPAYDWSGTVIAVEKDSYDKIAVTSYTVQAEGFDSALDAWNTAFAD